MTNKDAFQGTAFDSRSVVLGNEDFLTLLTSCIVCVVKGEASVVDYLLSWGFVHSMCDLLKSAIIRLLNQLVGRIVVLVELSYAK